MVDESENERAAVEARRRAMEMEQEMAKKLAGHVEQRSRASSHTNSDAF